MKFPNATILRTLQRGSIAIAAGGLIACGGGGGPATGTVNGTVTIGTALANSAVQLVCKNGTSSTTTDANGAYGVTFQFDGPCLITATSGTSVIHSFASGPGTFNVTPLTELLMDYLAGELGATPEQLQAGISSNTFFQNSLTNSVIVANAENATAQLVKKIYGVTLSSASFLTVSQPEANADLTSLLATGALDSNGAPVSTLVSAAISAGMEAPISSDNGGGATGGTGGTGGTGTTN